jgi:hypothetical protein
MRREDRTATGSRGGATQGAIDIRMTQEFVSDHQSLSKFFS